MKHFLSVTLLYLVWTCALFADTDKGQGSLKGLSGVYLVLTPVGEDVARDGLTIAHLRSLTEATLGQAGITLSKEPTAKDGGANLIVTVDTIKHPQGVYLFMVNVALVQNVQLSRSAKLGTMPSQTWGAISFGLTSPQKLDLIDEPLREKLGEFIKALKTANAR